MCGAWNFAVGDLVPLAPVGAVLPGDLQIAPAQDAGSVVERDAVLARRTGAARSGRRNDGLLILAPGLAAPGTPSSTPSSLRPDVVFDLDISPNRPDALCMAGVARDLAAALGEPWQPRYEAPSVPLDSGVDPALVTVESGDLCPRFTATVLEGVPDGPSPAWLARRLTLAGMRPINAVVDVSNYVMLDLGQPNHAYDLDRLGGGGLLIRRGRRGEPAGDPGR